MCRPIFIRYTVFACIVIAFLSCEKAQEESLKPNILFIAIDDLRPELGCYGNPVIKSPNLDRLAAEGRLFNRHYTQVPTCGPSRYCMLTGLRPKHRGEVKNDLMAKDLSNRPEGEVPETFVHHLRRNGYYTVGIGKISHYVDGLVYGYLDSVSTKMELPYSWDEFLSNQDKWGTGWNAFFGYADGENRHSKNKEVKPYERGEVGDEGYPDGITTNLAISQLRSLKEKKQPFFLGVGFFKPHLPFTAPAKYWDLYNREDMPVSPNPFLPQDVHRKSLHTNGEFNQYKLTDELASLEKPISEAYARKVMHAYYACVSYIDAQVGKVMLELDRLGLAENTIVVIWGDHGWHLGDHLLWGKHSLFERSLRSTLIVRAAGMPNPGKAATGMVETIDIYPTLMEMCGIEVTHPLDGVSFRPLLDDPLANGKEAVYGYFRNGITVRTNRYRYTRYFRDEKPTEELFDHASDPNETTNVASEQVEAIQSLKVIWEKGNTGIFSTD